MICLMPQNYDVAQKLGNIFANIKLRTDLILEMLRARSRNAISEKGRGFKVKNTGVNVPNEEAESINTKADIKK